MKYTLFSILFLYLLAFWARPTQPNPPSPILISSVYYDGLELNDLDEAVALTNQSNQIYSLANWRLTDGTTNSYLPTGSSIPPQSTIWISRNGTAFSRQFGFLPDWEQIDSNPNIPNLLGSWPGFSNSGDEVFLYNETDQLVDLIVYENGDTNNPNWNGPAVEPYTNNLFAAEGQILFRTYPFTDSNSLLDWGQNPNDPLQGRKINYPGWNLLSFSTPPQFQNQQPITIAITPDNGYLFLTNLLQQAEESIYIQSHTASDPQIASILKEKIAQGITVTILLEGGPPGGIEDDERYFCQQINSPNSGCWFMINNRDERIFSRYSYMHSKLILIDNHSAIISSENLSPNSFPHDAKDDGSWGRRGTSIAIENEEAILYLRQLFFSDFAPQQFVDLIKWNPADPTYGNPPPDYQPITITGGMSYTIQFPTPIKITDVTTISLLHSPENSLHPSLSPIGILSQAGAGDLILIEQLIEQPVWGSAINPRLEQIINAARKGAAVYLLLDQFFDPYPNSKNSQTCAYLQQIAAVERLRLFCQQNNPTGGGIHNKMILAQINGSSFIHLGSINGTETSHKANREIAIQLNSPTLFHHLAQLFWSDWPHIYQLPLWLNNYNSPATHPLISEIMYDPIGTDETEFIELINPTRAPIDISHWAIGDATDPTNFEDRRFFPEGTILYPNDPLIIATTATAFYAQYGRWPDFAIIATGSSIPELIDDPNWGDPAALLQLGNQGDELLLWNQEGIIIDAFAYGSGILPFQESCPLLSHSNWSWERFPNNKDLNLCSDFRAWPFPSPGSIP